MERSGGKVMMQQCETKKEQTVKCATPKDYQMEIKWGGNLYLHLPLTESRVIAKKLTDNKKQQRQQWSSKVKRPCKNSRAYNGIVCFQ
jgi:hypothetical protein